MLEKRQNERKRERSNHSTEPPDRIDPGLLYSAAQATRVSSSASDFSVCQSACGDEFYCLNVFAEASCYFDWYSALLVDFVCLSALHRYPRIEKLSLN